MSVAELVEEDRLETNRYTVSNPVFLNHCQRQTEKNRKNIVIPDFDRYASTW